MIDAASTASSTASRSATRSASRRTGPSRASRSPASPSYGDVDSLGGATLAIFDVADGAGAPRQAGRLDDDLGRGERRRLAGATLVSEIRPLLPATRRGRTGREQATEDEQGRSTSSRAHPRLPARIRGHRALRRRLRHLQHALDHGRATDARAGDAAHARRVAPPGARSVVLEAAVIGVVASLVGLVARARAREGPQRRSSPRSASTCRQPAPCSRRAPSSSRSLVGVADHARSPASSPALRATRVPPIAAVREGAVPPRRSRAPGRSSRRRARASALALLASARSPARLARRARCSRSARRARHCSSASRSSRRGSSSRSPRSSACPSRRLGGAAGRLARENVVRNPARTASTAAALMIGLALVTFVAVLGQGLRDSIANASTTRSSRRLRRHSQNGCRHVPRRRRRRAGAARRASQRRAASAATAPARRRDAGRSTASTRRRSTGCATSTGARRSDATLAALGADGAIVKDVFADDHDLARRRAASRSARPPASGVDSRCAASTSRRGSTRARSARRHLAADVRRHLRAPAGRVHARPTATPTRRTLERAVAAVPGRAGADAGRVRRQQSAWHLHDPEPALRPARALRAREPVRDGQHARPLGLRADARARDAARGRDDPPPGPADGPPRERHHGPDRRRARAAARAPPRCGDAGARRYGVAFALPVGSLVVFTLVAIVAGILAAILPARRASRLDVLSALHYE